jgi:hypothetical protein
LPPAAPPKTSKSILTKEQSSALADLILVVHFGFVAFVVGGLVLIWLGYFCKWRFVRHRGFRLAHLAAMAFVVGESLLGFLCPLTTWEAQLRLQAGGGTHYEGSFIQHWVHKIMFFELPERMFTVLYVAFFTGILLSWRVVRPDFRRPPPAA